MTNFPILLAVLTLFYSLPLHANFALNRLASDPSWLALGHYREAGIFEPRWESESDDDAFFLSANGKYSPQDELTATYQAQIVARDQVVICRFPARYYYLATKLGSDPAPLLEKCDALGNWQDKMSVVGATLIFPAAYLDSPSSMFGHTLLRLDQSTDRDSTGQLSYTYSFAAAMPESGSELAFVYRGLVGGYPGETSTPPYYLKLKEYRDIESRDIWEYELDFSSLEIEQLVRHIWEIKDLKFDYFFFGENCSYRVMALLNTIRPNAGLLNSKRIYTIPVVTVRDAWQANIVKNWRFRPSVKTKLNHDYEQLTLDEKLWVKNSVALDLAGLQRLFDSDRPSPNAIAVAYQYARMLPKEDEQAKQKSFALLMAQNVSSAPSTLNAVATPHKRDDEGHESERLTVTAGEVGDTAFLDIEIRPAYHELIDPSLGYPVGSELVFGKASARLFKGGDAFLKQVEVIGIKSLKPVTTLFKPVSWAVSIRGDRINVDGSNRFAPKLSGTLGKAVSLFEGSLLYGLAGGEALFNTRLDKNMDIIGVADLGFVFGQSLVRTKLSYQAMDSVLYSGKIKQTLKAESALQLSDSLSLNLSLQQHNLEQNRTEKSIGLHWFF